jgi:hypothetical protein
MTIDRPMYLVGFPHGGLTAVGVLISTSGEVFRAAGHKPGETIPDEMHNYYKSELPHGLKNTFGGGGWRLGWNRNIDKARLTEKDADDSARETYKNLLESLYSKYDGKRLLAKEQPFMLKSRYVQEILKPHEAYFMYIIRNPYVLGYKPAVFHNWYSPHVTAENSKEQYVRLGCEHVINSHNALMEDSKHLKHFKVVRFEDIMLNPTETMKEVFKFFELKGTHIDEKTGTKHGKPFDIPKYLVQHRNISGEYYDKIIEEKCGTMIEEFGYTTSGIE